MHVLQRLRRPVPSVQFKPMFTLSVVLILTKRSSAAI